MCERTWQRLPIAGSNHSPGGGRGQVLVLRTERVLLATSSQHSCTAVALPRALRRETGLSLRGRSFSRPGHMGGVNVALLLSIKPRMIVFVFQEILAAFIPAVPKSLHSQCCLASPCSGAVIHVTQPSDIPRSCSDSLGTTRQAYSSASPARPVRIGQSEACSQEIPPRILWFYIFSPFTNHMETHPASNGV